MNADAFYQALEKEVTPEIVARLDAVETQGKRTIPSLPTVQMDPEPETDRAKLPTVAMGEETLADVTDQPASHPDEEPASEPESATSSEAQPAQPAETEAPVSHVLEPQPSPPWLANLKPKPALLAVIGVLVVIALIFIFGNFSGSASCSSVDECMTITGELWEAGDLYGALESIDRVSLALYQLTNTQPTPGCGATGLPCWMNWANLTKPMPAGRPALPGKSGSNFRTML